MGGAGTWKYGTTHSESEGSAHLEVLDPKSGESLYADTQVRSRFIIKELRRRIEDQEKAPREK
jgi:hypothetical protein